MTQWLGDSIFRLVGSVVGFVVLATIVVVGCVSFATGDRDKGFETAANLNIIGSEYVGFGLSQVPNTIKSIGVGLTEGNKINDKARDKSGIFTEDSGKPKK